MKALIKASLGPRGCFLLKWLWIRLLSGTGLLSLAERRIAGSGGIVVLTFHRVLPESAYRTTRSPEGMLVRDTTFEHLARYISRHCHAVALDDGPEAVPAGGRPRVAFTFDDGWLDNFDVAAPIARKYRIPMTIFVCPAKVGQELPYWPERVVAMIAKARTNESAARAVDTLLAGCGRKAGAELPSITGAGVNERLIEFLKLLSKSEREELLAGITAAVGWTEAEERGSGDATMTWENMQALQHAGVRFAAHTDSHEILTRTPPREAERELAEAKRTLEAKLGGTCTMFAYPNGDWSHEIRDLVSRAGYQLALINQPGLWMRDTDPLLIPRSNIWDGRLVGPGGRFSASAFRYAAFWCAGRKRRRISKTETNARVPASAPTPGTEAI